MMKQLDARTDKTAGKTFRKLDLLRAIVEAKPNATGRG
jgi:hypothetical protein